MKNYLVLVLSIIIISLFVSGCGQGEAEQKDFQEAAEKEANTVFAEEFIMFLDEGRYDRATKYFDDTMKKELPANELEKLWDSLESQLGDFKNQSYDSTQKMDEYDVILINGTFEEDEVIFRITIDQNEKIAGFYLE